LAAQLEKVKTLQVIKEIIVNTHPFQTGLEYFDVDWYWMRLLHWAVQATPASPLRSKARNTWQRK